MKNLKHLFATLPAWLSGIVDTPTTEEGGPSGFTFDDKLQDLRWYTHVSDYSWTYC